MSGNNIPGIFFMNNALFGLQTLPTHITGLLAAGIIAAIVYVALWHARPEGMLRSVAKIIPMIALILIALFTPLPIIIIAALGACTVGDWFLSLEGERNFQIGLGAFLAGHLFYIGYFLPLVDIAAITSTDGLMLAAILVALVAMVLLRLWPFLYELKLPVAIYAAAIALMAYTARLAMPGFWVITGIALFMLSDILLAQDKFTPLTNSPARRAMPFLVMTLYYASQMLIVLGLLTTL